MRLCPRCLAQYPLDATECAIDGAALVVEADDPLIGATFNSYRIVEHAGTGGMARVYRAKHTLLDRWYAVKVLRGRLGASGTVLERFKREAVIVSRIEHPNVVGIVDFGATLEGRTFLVMEWISGAVLSELIRSEGPFAPARAAELARQIASGLAAAHRLGFVHRDLKPGNAIVMRDEIARREQVKLLDFGLAKIASEGIDGGVKLTEAGQLVGTPHYIAPEVFAGAEATPAADLYALGVVLYMMLSGDKPFKAKTIPELVRAQYRERVEPIARAAGLSEIAVRLLAPDPRARLGSAAEVIAAIDALGLGAWAMEAPTVVRKIPAAATGSYPVLDAPEEDETIGEREVSRVVVTGSYPRPERDTDVAVVRDTEIRAPMGPRVIEQRGRWLLPAAGIAAAAIAAAAIFAWTTKPPPQPLPAVVEKPAPPAVTARPRAIEEQPAPAVEAPAPVKEKRRAIAPDPAPAVAPVIETPAAAPPPVDAKILKARLGRISARLSDQAIPAEKLHALETRYFDLATAVQPGLQPADYEKLEKQIAELERDAL